MNSRKCSSQIMALISGGNRLKCVNVGSWACILSDTGGMGEVIRAVWVIMSGDQVSRSPKFLVDAQQDDAAERRRENLTEDHKTSDLNMHDLWSRSCLNWTERLDQGIQRPSGDISVRS